MNRHIFSFAFLTFIAFTHLSPGQPVNHPGDILSRLQRLNTLGSVLYVAAHPDDENTRMLAWLSKGMKVRTCYLSLTRGDGGQNLIGTEQGDALGVVRTQELLSARRIDGAEQYFTRAVDFGYSRNPEETLSKWDEETILSDVVWVLRQLRPDVIVTRFPATGEGGHGHHTASAILANKAFRLAADEDAFPEQLEFVSPWQAKRIFFNSFNFRSRPPQDYTGQIHVEVGGYDPLLGQSYGEIASLSRSQHKSQGFGVAISRGSQMEHYKRIDGDTAVSTLFEDIDMSWKRIGNGSKIADAVNELIHDFDLNAPHLSVEGLLKVRSMVSDCDDEYWKDIKMTEIDELIIACTGLYVSATSEDATASPGDSLNITFTALNRSPLQVTWEDISYSQGHTTVSRSLDENIAVTETKGVHISPEISYSTPYWLTEPRIVNPNMYTVSDRKMIGKPKNDEALDITFTFSILGIRITTNTPVVYIDVDPVKGETISSTAILPALTLNIKEGSFLFTRNEPQSVNLEIETFSEVNDAILKITLPAGWRSDPENIVMGDLEADQISNHSFVIVPPASFVETGKTSSFSVSVLTDDHTYDLSLQRIRYPHIRPQYLLKPASADLVPLDIKGNDAHIGYINGAGDKVAASLTLAGFTVDLLNEEDVVNGRLSEYKTVITGIRAFNKHEWLKDRQELLFDYVKEGGNLIVQYNTNSFFGSIDFNVGPYPFRITRDRVTVEETRPEFLLPDHPLMKTPNKISQDDFDDWVQERGLYFAGDVSDEYEKLIKWNDPGYDPTEGAIITCNYGKGHFTYTGISFFRQLPANVQGAYRLLTNMIHLGTHGSE
jgi:LmbE family N-acetylglucosaminyl deacetylase